MADTLVSKAIAEAERACGDAVLNTPEQYRQYLVFIRQNKRVGGSRQNPVFASIRLPYMSAAGRIQMARDDHKEQGKRLDIQVSHVQLGDKWFCKATIFSEIYGSTTDYSEVKVGGTGVDASNPWENASTSAVARALGYLAYGLYGNGIASAEEVLAAMEAQAETPTEDGTPTPEEEPLPPVPGEESTDSANPNLASEKQLGLLYGLLKKNGVLDHDKRSLVSLAYPKGLPKTACSDLINFLKSGDDLPAELWRPYVKDLFQRSGKTEAAVTAYLNKSFNTPKTQGLNGEQQKQLIEWLTTPDSMGDVGPTQTPAIPPHIRGINSFLDQVAKSGTVSRGDAELWLCDHLKVESVEAITPEAAKTIFAISMQDVERRVREYLESAQQELKV